MATGKQLITIIKSHFEDNSERFNTIALQIAAQEAKQGHSTLANEIRKLIDESKITKPKFKLLNPELNDLVLEIVPDEKLSNLIVSKIIKDRIFRVINEFEQRDKLLRHDLENRRKLLFTGSPGTGKTMTASIIANEIHLPMYVIQMDKMVTKYMGETSAKLRQIFELIENNTGVYLFDEFDAIGSQRSKDNDVGEMRRVLNTFLQLIESDHSESLIIAATNNLELLDQALFRRFDDVIYYSLPSDEEKMKLLRNKLFPNINNSAIKKLIPQLDSLSHAEISKACLDAIKESILLDGKLTIELLEKTIKERKMAYKIQL